MPNTIRFYIKNLVWKKHPLPLFSKPNLFWANVLKIWWMKNVLKGDRFSRCYLYQRTFLLLGNDHFLDQANLLRREKDYNTNFPFPIVYNEIFVRYSSMCYSSISPQSNTRSDVDTYPSFLMNRNHLLGRAIAAASVAIKHRLRTKDGSSWKIWQAARLTRDNSVKEKFFFTFENLSFM